MQLTFKVRAYPTKKQHAVLAEYLDHTRQLYNAALQERRDCYEKTRRTITAVEQSRELTQLRADPEYARFPRRMQRWAINLVEAAYRGMFTRHKKGEKLGHPRFRGWMFWDTLGWDSPIDFSMRERGIYHRKSFGGTLRLHRDRPLPDWDKCTAFTLHRDGDRWFAHLTFEFPDVKQKEAPRRPVGIDMGLITLAMRSDGIALDAPREHAADTAAKRIAARALSRCKKRSKRRRRVRVRLARVNARIARRRKAHLHLISARLTHHFDAVAVEDLNLRGLNRGGGGGAKGRGVRKAWRDRAPGQLAEMLAWKCERDGRPFARVDPRFTSILCSACGAEVRKTLRQRQHVCGCGAVLDRDHNAARNILARGGWAPGDAKLVEGSAVQAASGAGLSLKHGGRKAAGPRRGQESRPPPSSTLRGRNASG